jgi:hypothetical protein
MTTEKAPTGATVPWGGQNSAAIFDVKNPMKVDSDLANVLFGGRERTESQGLSDRLKPAPRAEPHFGGAMRRTHFPG